MLKKFLAMLLTLAMMVFCIPLLTSASDFSFFDIILFKCQSIDFSSTQVV